MAMDANEGAHARSRELMQRASRVIPGGVNSPARAFSGVGGTPLSFESASGPYLEDIDGNRYIDYVGSWGPMILGHAPPDVVEAVTRQARQGLGFGAPTELEVTMAEQVISMVPSIEMVRMVNSGTEATMSTIRLARGFTGRDLIIKFAGCYHGHSDSLLVRAGSGLLTLAIPSSPGVPEAFAAHTLNLPYNDTDALAEALAQYGERTAAVIVEPVAGNMGCVPPVPGFLEALRELTERHGVLLIFDEVMTGFRVARGGAQELYGVTPDLTALGKIIGGGLPVGAFGGRRDIMEQLAPGGPVYQAGTLSGNPLAMAAGLTTLRALEREDFYTELDRNTQYLSEELTRLAHKHGIDATANAVCGMFSLFFTDTGRIRSFDDVAACDKEAFNRFFHAMLQRGIYLAPSAFEAAFLSAAHESEQLDQTLCAADEALREQHS